MLAQRIAVSWRLRRCRELRALAEPAEVDDALDPLFAAMRAKCDAPARSRALKSLVPPRPIEWIR